MEQLWGTAQTPWVEVDLVTFLLPRSGKGSVRDTAQLLLLFSRSFFAEPGSRQHRAQVWLCWNEGGWRMTHN